MAATPLPAAPEHAETSRIVQLPEIRPGVLRRSLDGGSTWVDIAEISEAWTASTFQDLTVPAVAVPLYVFDDQQG